MFENKGFMYNLQIYNNIRNTIRHYDMLTKGDRVLICVSGGPDSVFLAHALKYLGKEFACELFIANIDHGIRGKASAMDSRFVKKLALSLGLLFFFKKIKIKKTKGFSQEEIARQMRYECFEDIARTNHMNKIATAHTLNDQAETVLMRIIKGTSLKGLTGIPAVRSGDNMTFIRPIIEIEKDDIIKFLKSKRISYIIDHTNYENKYFRNIVRNNILPYLSKYNPKIKRALFNMAMHLTEDRAFIDQAKQMAVSKITHDKGGTSLALKDIVVQPRAIQREVLRDALMNAGGNIKKLTFRHWKDIECLLRQMPSGKSLDLPGNITISKNKKMLHFTHK